MGSRSDSGAWPAPVAPEVNAAAEGLNARTDAPEPNTWGQRFRRFQAWAQKALGSRRAPLGIVAIGFLLTSTALTLGFTADDHLHTLALRGDGAIPGFVRAPWDIFAFARDPDTNRLLMEEGVFAWWADPEVRISFFRPLTSLTHWLDHRLWPEQPGLMHLHNLLWYVALMLVVAQVYRQHAASAWIAGLALFIYAVDDARGLTVGWLSNRNALVALTPGFAALALHHKWRSEGRARYGVFAALMLMLAVLGAEAGFQICGYLAAYALCLERGSLLQRLRTLAPYALIVVTWRALYVSRGYGAFGSEFYVDPGRTPLLFLQKLMVRLPVLLLAEFGAPLADFWDAYPLFAPFMRVVVPIFGVIAIGLLCWLLWPLARSDARIRFWALGTLFATLPVCSATPNDRLLTATGVGGSALLAALIAAFAEKVYPVRSRLQPWLVGSLVLMHLVVAPLFLPIRTRAVDGMEDVIVQAAASVPSDDSVTSKTVVILNPPVEHFASYFPLHREAHDIPRPKHFRWLATGLSAIDLKRVDAQSFTVRPEGGFLGNEIQWFLRSRQRPFHLHQRIEFEGFSLEVTELTPDQRPAEVLARFDEPLGGKSVEFMQWGEHEYVPLKLPEVGQSLHVPKVDLASAFGM